MSDVCREAKGTDENRVGGEHLFSPWLRVKNVLMKNLNDKFY